ncbi:hypothetical protein SRHO_G00133800 [Serrasalmus rhombeus]
MLYFHVLCCGVVSSGASCRSRSVTADVTVTSLRFSPKPEHQEEKPGRAGDLSAGTSAFLPRRTAHPHAVCWGTHSHWETAL